MDLELKAINVSEEFGIGRWRQNPNAKMYYKRI